MSQQKPQTPGGTPEPDDTVTPPQDAAATAAPVEEVVVEETAEEPPAPSFGDDDEDDTYVVPAGTVVAAGSSLVARLGAEAFGTFAFVLVGLGVALYSNPGLGSVGGGGGPLAVALAFGLALAALVAAVGHVSGGHFNPAVTFGAALAGRIGWADVLPYWIVQLAGGALGAAVVSLSVPTNLPRLLSADGQGGKETFFASVANGYGEHSALGAATAGSELAAEFGLTNVLLVETVAVALLVGVILAVTDRRASRTLPPLAIGLAFTALMLFTLPVTNGALNPARSFAAAIFSGGWAWEQLWVFWAAPLLGAAIAALVYRAFAAEVPQDSLLGEDDLYVTERDVVVTDR